MSTVRNKSGPVSIFDDSTTPASVRTFLTRTDVQQAFIAKEAGSF